MEPRNIFNRGGCGIKAESACRLVLPGVGTVSSFEEGIFHVWKG